ncbi:hypothetical protein [Streptomyces sp. NPDC045470]|uniref:hypothetical protein n=1 Tax=Streptomyces sp. NPDC045470 TaxID=3155469 RepID=UPI00340AF465
MSESLGMSPRCLARLHAVDSPASVLAQLVATAARHLDHVHEQVTDAAHGAASTLTRVAAGRAPINSLGILQNSATQIDILAARRADAVEHLLNVLHAYRQVTTSDGAAHPAPRPGKTPGQSPTPNALPARVPRGR